MISIVVYGRNDNYGYNLHKRAALSLNCMAEVLADPEDEIIFVDYNTPDDYPTFPEAIRDTLTDRTRKHLRVLRVRHGIHRRFQDRTRSVVLEPIARNIGVRRSRSANPRILSTNTDMVFVPEDLHSLTDLVRDLPDGLYHLPRFDVPESLWESLDRTSPRAVIEQFRTWGRSFHLNEVVVHDDIDRYDNPGDFQLIRRDDLFELCGFDERMLLGRNVDRNIARRLYLRYGRAHDLFPSVLGYHCDHTRDVTPMHRADRIENDLKLFDRDIMIARLDEQADSWGMPEEPIEEIRLSAATGGYISALNKVIPTEMGSFSMISRGADGYDHVSYDAKHVLPFLADVFVNNPSSVRLGWFGCRRDLLDLFCHLWRVIGDRPTILVARECKALGPDLPMGAAWVSASALLEEADAFVFDFGFAAGEIESGPSGIAKSQALAIVADGLRMVSRAEASRLEEGGMESRRLISVNAIHNRYEAMVRGRIAAADAPIGTRVRQGFLRRWPTPRQLLASMSVGAVGRRDRAVVRAGVGRSGYILYGPYLDLDEGSYRLQIDFVPCPSLDLFGSFTIEVLEGKYIVALHRITWSEAQHGNVEMLFRRQARAVDDFDEPLMEFRIATDGSHEMILTGITVAEAEADEAVVQLIDWLPLMHAGDASEWIRSPEGVSAIRSRLGVPGLVSWGPYSRHRIGEYVLRCRVRCDAGTPRWVTPIGRVEVIAGNRTLIAGIAYQTMDMLYGEVVVPFTLSERTGDIGLLEFKFWTDGRVQFDLLGAVVEPRMASDNEIYHQRASRAVLAGAEREEFLARMSVGPAGRREELVIVGILGQSGNIVYGPYLDLPVGHYRLELRFSQIERAADYQMIRIDVVDGSSLIAESAVDNRELNSGSAEILFQVAPLPIGKVVQRQIEFRVWTDGTFAISIREIWLSAADGGDQAEVISL